MNLQLRTSTRTRNKPQSYTPAKYENFNIDKNKALDKKMEACKRTIDIVMVEKHQNYILELSAGAYEVLKIELEKYFDQHCTYKIAPTNQYDNQGLCIRTSFSVINRSNNRQLYRINLFHTTSRIEVNGHGMEHFITHMQEIKENMKTKGSYKKLNKQIEDQINAIKENNIDMKHKKKMKRTLQAEPPDTNLVSITNEQICIMAIDGGTCDAMKDDDLHGGWVRSPEVIDQDARQHIQHMNIDIVQSQNELALVADDREVNNCTLIYTICEVCSEEINSDASIDCDVCKQSMHYRCENLPDNYNEEQGYTCKSCKALDIQETIPKQSNIDINEENLVIMQNPEGHYTMYNTTQDKQEHETFPKINSYDLNQVNHIMSTIEGQNQRNKLAIQKPTEESSIDEHITRRQKDKAESRDKEPQQETMPKQISPTTMNSENTNIVDDCIKNGKNKQKKQQRSKENVHTQQLEEQLAQCKARIVMMEDTNRDYKNTINLLRMQAEESSALNDINNKKLNKTNCNCYGQLQDQLDSKLDMILNNFRLEMENRDLKLKHQIDISELKNRMQMLEMQRDIGMWQNTYLKSNDQESGHSLRQNPNLHVHHSNTDRMHNFRPVQIPPVQIPPVQMPPVQIPQYRTYAQTNQGPLIYDRHAMGYKPATHAAPQHYYQVPVQTHHTRQRNSYRPTSMVNDNVVHTRPGGYVHPGGQLPGQNIRMQEREREQSQVSHTREQMRLSNTNSSLMREQQQVSNKKGQIRSDNVVLKQTKNTTNNRNDKEQHLPLAGSSQQSNNDDNKSANGPVIQTEESQDHRDNDQAIQSCTINTEQTNKQITIDPGKRDRSDPHHQASGGDAPPDPISPGCCQRLSSQRCAEGSGHRPEGSERSLQTEKITENQNPKPNHFLDCGRSNKIKGRSSL